MVLWNLRAKHFLSLYSILHHISSMIPWNSLFSRGRSLCKKKKLIYFFWKKKAGVWWRNVTGHQTKIPRSGTQLASTCACIPLWHHHCHHHLRHRPFAPSSFGPSCRPSPPSSLSCGNFNRLNSVRQSQPFESADELLHLSSNLEYLKVGWNFIRLRQCVGNLPNLHQWPDANFLSTRKFRSN